MEILVNGRSPEKGTSFEKEAAARPCWSCDSKEVNLYNCNNCASIQQFLHDTDYFLSLNIGYKLNIDLDFLEKQYYELSRRFHPDYFQRSSTAEQGISLENTALLNQSYQTLKDPLKRTAYLITLVEGDKKIATEAPTALFEDIFEIQEALEEIRGLEPSDEAKRMKLTQTLSLASKKMQQFEDEEKKALHTLFLKWDQLEIGRSGQDFTDAQKSCLAEMKQIISHTAYLSRLMADIKMT